MIVLQVLHQGGGAPVLRRVQSEMLAHFGGFWSHPLVRFGHVKKSQAPPDMPLLRSIAGQNLPRLFLGGV